MNIVSSTGRCGSPLLANYGATHAALWTLGETLSREWADTDLAVTTFVAPAMHSPLQKLMGRIALRYFRISGGFDYADPDEVASQAVSAFWNAEAVHVGKPSRLKLWTNALFPKLVDRKTRKVWKKDRAR
jgi:short-subunit dehydrogenase